MKEQKIGFWSSTSLVMGNMIGSGIFLLPAALAFYGGISIFGWIFTTAGSIFLSLVFARLRRIIKDPGGPYAYSRESSGKFPGFLVAWGYWVSIWCGNAAIAVAGTGYLGSLIPALADNKVLSAILSIAVLWIFTLINTRRIRIIARVQVLATIIKILPLLIMGTLGFLYFNPENFKPLNLSGISDIKAVTACAALTLWAFLGLESATIPSDRVKQPERIIPLSTIAGTLLSAIVFIAATTAVMGIIKPSALAMSESPFSDAAGILWGDTAAALFALAAVISCYGALNGWILLQGQIPLAAANDKLFPSAFSRLSKKSAPVFGLIFSSILASLLVSINYSRGLIGMFSFIIRLSTLTVLLPYVLSAIAELLLYTRGKREATKKKLIAAMITGIPAFLYSLWAVVGLGFEVISWGILLLLTGIPVYISTIRKDPGSASPGSPSG